MASTTLHWLASQWTRAAPGVAARLRKFADHFGDRAAALRRHHLEANLATLEASPDRPTIDTSDEPTDPVTIPFGTKPPEE